MIPELDIQHIIQPFQILNLQTGFKIVLLIIIALYSIFTFTLFNQVRALGRVVFFPSKFAGLIIKLFAFCYFLAVVSLFLITLVIV